MFYAVLGGGGGGTISPKHFCLSLQLLLYLIKFMELQEVFSKLSVAFLFCTVFTRYMLVPGMPTLECQSVGRSGQSNSLVWTDIHQLFDGLPWNVLQAFRVFLDNAFYILVLWGLLHTHVLARLDSVWLSWTKTICKYSSSPQFVEDAPLRQFC